MLARARRRSIRSWRADAESAAACSAACAAASRRRQSALGPSPWRGRPRGDAACRSRRNGSWLSLPGLPHFSRGLLDRLVDLLVTRTAAQVARDRFLDPLAAWVWFSFEQGFCGHQDAGGAVAALCPAEIGERGLQWVQLGAVCEPLHGFDRPPFAIEGKREAGEHRHAFHQHRAGAAFAELAAVLGAGQVQVLAQHFEQRLVRGERNLLLLAVHAQREVDVLRRGSFHFTALGRGARTSPRTRYSDSEWAISATDCGPSGRYQRAVQLTAPSIARVTSAGSVGANSPRFIPSATRLRTARS